MKMTMNLKKNDNNNNNNNNNIPRTLTEAI